MSVSGDASEQIVKLSLEGFEVIAKLSGTGAKNVMAMLYTIMKDQTQTKGKARLNTMLRTGKPLKVFSIKNEDLARFQQEATKYGILYCVLVNDENKNLDGMADIMVKEEDAARINRIVQRFKLSTIDTAQIDTEVTKAIKKREEQKKELGVQEKSKEEQLEDVLEAKPIQKENNNENFNLAKTEKSPQSEPSSTTSKTQEGVSKIGKKPSVRKELAKLKVKAQEQEEIRVKEKNNIKAITSSFKSKTDR